MKWIDLFFTFCNGPACHQSSNAIKAMVKEGFPSNKIFYYRGGLQTWAGLGFPITVDH